MSNYDVCVAVMGKQEVARLCIPITAASRFDAALAAESVVEDGLEESGYYARAVLVRKAPENQVALAA